MSTNETYLLVTVAGGQPEFDAELKKGLAARGVRFEEMTLTGDAEALLDAIEAGGRPVMLKPAAA
jgi:hypothetical protein